MKLEIHSNQSSRPATQEAAAWFARHRQGPLSEADALAFRRWLEASPEHVQAWNSQRRMWVSLQSVRDAPAILALRENARTGLRRHRMRRIAWQAGAALAATVIFGLFISQQPPPPPAGSIVRTAASSALLKHSNEQRALPQVTDVSTRIGERALVRLADNSLVTLNTDSAIHVDLSDAQRSITLVRGEAYFEVAKDKTRPFVVAAGGRQVVAVGTAFAVKLHQQDVQVNLVEGKVRVEHVASSVAAPMSDAVMLDAGMSLVARVDGDDRVGTLNVEREVSWRSGKLVFPGDRLADVIAEMNRYSTQKIELLDAALGEQLLSGVFDPAGGAELARALESYGMVRIIDQDISRIILAAPEAVHKKNAAP